MQIGSICRTAEILASKNLIMHQSDLMTPISFHLLRRNLLMNTCALSVFIFGDSGYLLCEKLRKFRANNILRGNNDIFFRQYT